MSIINNKTENSNNNAKKPIMSNSLYVGDLHPDINETFLFDLFREHGTIQSIKVCRDNVTSKSLGYAYVNFQKPEEAAKAIDELNFVSIKGQPIRIMWSQRDPSVRRSGVGNIFIKNLEKSIDNKALYDTFGIFGKILSCKVSTRPVERIINGKKETVDESLGYGFVHFETQKAADNAIQKVNGMMINNKKVYVGHHMKKNERKKDGEDQVIFTNVYVNNLPLSFDDNDLYKEFEKFGEIVSAIVEKDEKIEKVDNEEKKVKLSKGFGFVCFKKFEDAKKACEEMNNKEYDGKKIYCGRAEKKSERLQKLKEEYKKKIDEYQKTQGLNLYFKNIDETAYDEETLKKILSEFGEITSFCVMRNNDEKKTPKGFGFVSFKKAEDAQNAIQKLHGKMINEKSKPLYITVFQPKDIRRQHLEIQYSQRNFTSNPYQNGFLPNQTQNQFYNNIMRPRWTNQNQNQGQNNQRKKINQPYNKNMNNNSNSNNRDMNNNFNNNRANTQSKGYKFNQNVKNPLKGTNETMVTQKTEHTQTEESSNVLSTSYLANLQPKEVRQILGERLYPMVSQISNNQMVGKITGMLLDMDTSEILLLLESPESLEIKVNQALKTLENAKKTQTNVE